MRITDTKVKRIIEKDYSGSSIRAGQEWYIGNGVFLGADQTKTHLLNMMEDCKKAVEYAALLKNTIDEELGRYRVTDNLYGSVLELCEILSLIEYYAQEYIHILQRLNAREDGLRAEYLSEEGSSLCSIKEGDVY